MEDPLEKFSLMEAISVLKDICLATCMEQSNTFVDIKKNNFFSVRWLFQQPQLKAFSVYQKEILEKLINTPGFDQGWSGKVVAGLRFFPEKEDIADRDSPDSPNDPDGSYQSRIFQLTLLQEVMKILVRAIPSSRNSSVVKLGDEHKMAFNISEVFSQLPHRTFPDLTLRELTGHLKEMAKLIVINDELVHVREKYEASPTEEQLLSEIEGLLQTCRGQWVKPMDLMNMLSAGAKARLSHRGGLVAFLTEMGDRFTFNGNNNVQIAAIAAELRKIPAKTLAAAKHGRTEEALIQLLTETPPSNANSMTVKWRLAGETKLMFKISAMLHHLPNDSKMKPEAFLQFIKRNPAFTVVAKRAVHLTDYFIRMPTEEQLAREIVGILKSCGGATMQMSDVLKALPSDSKLRVPNVDVLERFLNGERATFNVVGSGVVPAPREPRQSPWSPFLPRAQPSYSRSVSDSVSQLRTPYPAQRHSWCQAPTRPSASTWTPRSSALSSSSRHSAYSHSFYSSSTSAVRNPGTQVYGSNLGGRWSNQCSQSSYYDSHYRH